MSEEDIKKLARQIAEEYYNCTCNEKGINLMAMEYEDVLKRVSKDYCIVSKEMIMAEYADAKATRDLYMSATCINTMESRAIDHSNGRMYELNKLFGKSTFEERSEK